ncbi:molybdopterin-dependent oxidoreductase [Amycolatopsis sp. CA-230715]|uniref:molybdopterin-dependent oxidoreductase n=1 Tax=Amycolatopsis sp. CA-230715 TaxID=2745196 RepID=UPI001C02E149|nr:molybdopterin-dependent oxidoreductase [Amycolatopsis sp. CA-230715]
MGKWWAALLGVVALAAALGAGQLVAAFVGTTASPFLAVANFVIDHSPQPIVKWAERTLETWDKPVLKLGLGVLLVVFAMLAGLFSRRKPLPGQLVIGILGAAGIAAVYVRQDLGPVALLAPVVTLLAGIGVFTRLHSLALRTPSVAGGAGDGTTRRQFLVTTGGVAAGAGVAALAGQFIGSANDAESSRAMVGKLTPAKAAPPIPADADFAKLGTPPFITPNKDFYRIDTALVVPQVRAEDWSLRVHGMVDREVTFDYTEIRNRPLVEQTVTMTCVSNEVGGPYISTANFVGVWLRDLLDEAGVQPGAQQLFATSSDGWTCGSPVEAALDPKRGAMLAIGMNGEPLPLEHGFPARIVIPGLYGYVSGTKWVADLELTTWQARRGYWLDRGWGEQGPIKTMSRIDSPQGFQSLPAGKVTVSGIAWAQTTGIEKVEVRLDNGPWQAAELSTVFNDNTWRMWHLLADVPKGSHTVAVRATDKLGYTQTEQRASTVPDGATGWHTVVFDAQ